LPGYRATRDRLKEGGASCCPSDVYCIYTGYLRDITEAETNIRSSADVREKHLLLACGGDAW